MVSPFSLLELLAQPEKWYFVCFGFVKSFAGNTTFSLVKDSFNNKHAINTLQRCLGWPVAGVQVCLVGGVSVSVVEDVR